MTLRLDRTAHLYGGVIDWALIESHRKEFSRVALAIQSGRVAASWILTREAKQKSSIPGSKSVNQSESAPIFDTALPYGIDFPYASEGIMSIVGRFAPFLPCRRFKHD